MFMNARCQKDAGRFVNKNAEEAYRNIVWPELQRTITSETILYQLAPQQTPIKRVRNGGKYNYEDHTYTFIQGDLFVSTFDQTISNKLIRNIDDWRLMATYFIKNNAVCAACIAPAIYITSMFNYKDWTRRNSFEPNVHFKILPFEEVRQALTGRQDIPFLYWSARRNHFEISNAMR